MTETDKTRPGGDHPDAPKPPARKPPLKPKPGFDPSSLRGGKGGKGFGPIGSKRMTIPGKGGSR